ncbi:MAG: cytochrome c [Acidobacteria bacterium]|nr:cytochrome c [Acidobacteriota bacterium]
MRNFLLGVIVTLVLIAIGLAGVVLLGMAPTRADSAPPGWEMRLAHTALDRAIDRNAPRVNNPIPPTDANLIDGMKTYVMACAECHGGLDRKPSAMAHSFYPPAPSLIVRPLDDPEWQVFYTVQTGVRNTGMPAWNKTMSETDMWKVVAFLTRVEKLPPAAQDYWQKSAGVAPPAEGEDHHDHSHHE